LAGTTRFEAQLMGYKAALVPPSEIATLTDEWGALADTRPSATVFDHPDFVLPLLRAFPAGALGCLTLRQADRRLAGIMPVIALPLRVGPFTARETGFPSNAHTLRHNPLLPEDGRADRAFVSALAQYAGGRDTVRLANLPIDLAGRLEAAATAEGLRCDRVMRGRMLYTADLSRGYEGWLAGLSSTNRARMRKAVRRAEGAGTITCDILRGADLAAARDTWRRVIERSWQGRDPEAGANRPEDWVLHDGLIGNGFLALLSIDGQTVAAHRWLQHRHTIYSHVQHYDLAYRKAQPGYALIAHVLKQADVLGFDTVDLNGSTDQYRQMHDGVREHGTLRIYLPGPRPCAVRIIRRLRSALRPTDAAPQPAR
jgi:CelD/BcsL family acetyltransferase involved in cellulose biosynthesis